MKNYYEILGVEKTASIEQIKKNFRQGVHAKHPDKGGNFEDFESYLAAYKILRDPIARKTYDDHLLFSESFAKLTKNVKKIVKYANELQHKKIEKIYLGLVLGLFFSGLTGISAVYGNNRIAYLSFICSLLLEFTSVHQAYSLAKKNLERQQALTLFGKTLLNVHNEQEALAIQFRPRITWGDLLN